MSESSSSSSSGIGAFGLLGVAFVVLKLTHVINWSWWWVTAPFWGGFALLMAILFGVGFIVGIVAVTTSFLDKRRRGRLYEHKRAIERD